MAIENAQTPKTPPARLRKKIDKAITAALKKERRSKSKCVACNTILINLSGYAIECMVRVPLEFQLKLQMEDPAFFTLMCNPPAPGDPDVVDGLVTYYQLRTVNDLKRYLLRRCLMGEQLDNTWSHEALLLNERSFIIDSTHARNNLFLAVMGNRSNMLAVNNSHVTTKQPFFSANRLCHQIIIYAESLMSLMLFRFQISLAVRSIGAGGIDAVMIRRKSTFRLTFGPMVTMHSNSAVLISVSWFLLFGVHSIEINIKSVQRLWRGLLYNILFCTTGKIYNN